MRFVAVAVALLAAACSTVGHEASGDAHPTISAPLHRQAPDVR